MTQSELNNTTMNMLGHHSRMRKEAVDYPDLPGYRVVDPSVWSGLVNSVRDYTKLLVQQRCKFPEDSSFDKVVAFAKSNGSEDNLYFTLAYLATWGNTNSVTIFCWPPDTDYFGFQAWDKDALGAVKVIMKGGVQYYPEGNRWQVHT